MKRSQGIHDVIAAGVTQEVQEGTLGELLLAGAWQKRTSGDDIYDQETLTHTYSDAWIVSGSFLDQVMLLMSLSLSFWRQCKMQKYLKAFAEALASYHQALCVLQILSEASLGMIFMIDRPGGGSEY